MDVTITDLLSELLDLFLSSSVGCLELLLLSHYLISLPHYLIIFSSQLLVLSPQLLLYERLIQTISSTCLVHCFYNCNNSCYHIDYEYSLYWVYTHTLALVLTCVRDPAAHTCLLMKMCRPDKLAVLGDQCTACGEYVTTAWTDNHLTYICTCRCMWNLQIKDTFVSSKLFQHLPATIESCHAVPPIKVTVMV